MTGALQRIETLCGHEGAVQAERWLIAAAAWPSSSAFLHAVETAADKDVLRDHFATLRYALVFRGLGFSPTFEPTGRTGPDLSVSRDAVTATVEVSRFTAMNEGPRPITPEELNSESFILEPYGNPRRDIPKCVRKVRDKFRQTTAALSLIAVWNDDEALEDVEMVQAIRELRHDANAPSGLQYVIYGSRWEQRLHCLPMKVPPHASVQHLPNELWSVSIDAAVEAGLK